jgi:L-cysteine desulfidase
MANVNVMVILELQIAQNMFVKKIVAIMDSVKVWDQEVLFVNVHLLGLVQLVTIRKNHAQIIVVETTDGVAQDTEDVNVNQDSQELIALKKLQVAQLDHQVIQDAQIIVVDIIVVNVKTINVNV